MNEDKTEYIENLEKQLRTAQGEADTFKNCFNRLTNVIMNHMQERYMYTNLCYSYRTILKDLAKQINPSLTEEEQDDFIRLEAAQIYIRERQKYGGIV